MITSLKANVTDAALWFFQTASDFIYDYQTLITGVLAVGAAYYGASPVWRQLNDSNVQTRIMLRDSLAVRLREAEERKARVSTSIEDALWQAQRVTSEHQGEPIEISEHDAFDLDQMIEGHLDWYLVVLRDTEDSSIEEAKSKFKQALNHLTDVLSDIHWPAHNDQHGENYSMTDEEWADVLQKAAVGKVKVSQKVGDAWKAFYELQSAQGKSIDELLQRIARLDFLIARDN